MICPITSVPPRHISPCRVVLFCGPQKRRRRAGPSVRIGLAFILALILTQALLGAAEPLPQPEQEPTQRIDPMDTSGLDYGIANVLRNYYRNNFTDAVTWEETESIRFDGTLHMRQGVLRFVAFKKKPDYCKVVIFAGNGGRLVMAYDGADAWQLNTLQPDAEPTAMPEAEALNFIRDATTGGHLFYPLAVGKTITLAGTADVEGHRAYHLSIELPDGQQIQSYLNMTTFAEIRQVTTNNVNGDEEVTTHSDFRQIGGIRVPYASTLTVDGQQVHQTRMHKVQVNVGAMPWMFSRPSGAYVPNSSAPSEPGEQEHALTPPASERSWEPTPALDPESISRLPDIWAPSAFVDPDHLSADEIKSLSEQISQPVAE